MVQLASRQEVLGLTLILALTLALTLNLALALTLNLTPTLTSSTHAAGKAAHGDGARAARAKG